jgi:hypothetical protein
VPVRLSIVPAFGNEKGFMSWSINIVGKPDDVNAAIQKDEHLPVCLKEVVRVFTNAGKEAGNRPGAIQVETSGHYALDNGHSNIYQFRINPIVLAVPDSSPPA